MVYKENELDKVVEYFLKETEGLNIIGLSGNLGAGKTTFVKALLKSLGVAQNVVSPTFVLRRDYEARFAQQNMHVVHIDAYRLEKPEQIYQVITKEELEDKNNLVIVEWPELSENIFQKIFLFEHVDEDTRKISIKSV